ncbi:MAG: HEPN domain-containing protein, partial [Dehalococcoidia bacterium]|nr:HEPN domain-containing protein [Dehalococcoidia bacterium]
DMLAKFKDFYNQYFDIIKSKEMPLYIAINRFSSSYDKRTLADKLVDLMIAMEALLGSQTEITYKIALRFAYLLYPPSEDRKDAFRRIKKVYSERSKLVHGDRLEPKYTETQVDNFEDEVRRLIIKVLELNSQGIVLDSEEKIDNFLFFDNVN